MRYRVSRQNLVIESIGVGQADTQRSQLSTEVCLKQCKILKAAMKVFTVSEKCVFFTLLMASSNESVFNIT